MSAMSERVISRMMERTAIFCAQFKEATNDAAQESHKAIFFAFGWRPQRGPMRPKGKVDRKCDERVRPSHGYRGRLPYKKNARRNPPLRVCALTAWEEVEALWDGLYDV